MCLAAVERLRSPHGRAIRGGRLAGKTGEVLLDRLEFSQRATELLAFVDVSDGQRERRIERTGYLAGAGECHCEITLDRLGARHDQRGQVDAERVVSRKAEHGQRVEPIAAEAALSLGNKQQGKPQFIDPRAVDFLGCVGTEFGEQGVGHFGQHAPAFIHRSPSPRAMMPFTISRVPPRSEKLGLTCRR